MKLSIIVPVYNSEQYLKQTIDCILSQTMSDFELILIDDGGSDKSSKLCDKYAKTDARIMVVHQTNKGIGGARNQGLKMMTLFIRKCMRYSLAWQIRKMLML